jgi:hypothetical protein
MQLTQLTAHVVSTPAERAGPGVLLVELTLAAVLVGGEPGLCARISMGSP